ncbi:hypothetical protein CVS30_12555 [Arthrobacter psychrolactophilus]|uniref:Uncharacterized protein n=1 Tax=Arthrobacter psychrolactophilus TaxID=92442 RepID=A0A2V5IVA3_9MICC|nr:hypothetical protein [Arthrobacter psychrolactophilus]PYI38044.1 hypothetical protein CVS30_12555 [Arthrobacter psychrolactophilus]
MRTSLRIISALSLTATLALSVAACSSSPEENTASACSAQTAFVTAVNEVKTSLDESSTLAEIKVARDKVSTAYSTLNKELDNVGSDQAKELETAWKDLDKAVSDLDDGLTVPQAKDALSGSLSKVENAQTAVKTGLDCS